MTGRSGRKRKGWRLSAKLLVASTLVTILGFTAVCVSVMIDMRHGEGELARRTSENLASSIDADISRNIEIFDLSLRNVTNQVVSPDVQAVSPALRHLILFDHAATAKHFGAIQVFDANGNLTIDASTLDPIKSNSADEEFFRVHADNPVVGLFISSPIYYRGAYSIVLSRRIDKDGGFFGVVAGTIRVSYFNDLLGRLSLFPDDAIAILRQDGVLVMRMPFDVDVIGKNFSHTALTQTVMSKPSGSLSYAPIIDGIPRLYVWRDSTKPLVVVVGRSLNGIYAMWRTQALRIAVVMSLLIAFAVTITLFLASEISRRARAEARLEELATTDALTGLRNRRKFDSAVDQEWRRAERNRTSLALLMIDADNFKSFNDRFGHQAGDQALAAISACIAVAARRAGDCAARYGGEEFAVLLPGEDASSALQVAESIRRDVAALDVKYAPLTISIGVAVIIPNGEADAVILIEAADKALYVAKANGRNQSRVAPRAKIAIAA